MSAPALAPENRRNASLEDIVTLLTDQNTRKNDIVVPASCLSAADGDIVVSGAEAELTADGVTSVDGRYTPTRVFDEGVAEKLGIPVAYVRRMRAEHVGLYDANINGWLRADGEARKFLLRGFRGQDGGQGIARALLSDTYKAIDDLDVLTAVFDGIHQSGAEVTVHSCDMTDRRTSVRLHAPGIAALAPVLLSGYRSPFDDPTIEEQRRHDGGIRGFEGGSDVESIRRLAAGEGQGYAPGTEPIVFAGMRISNSEVGGGAMSIVPELRVKICGNGLTVTQDALRNVHLGGKLEAGQITWSTDTQKANLALIASKARDAVGQWLDVAYITKILAGIEEKAGKPVTDPEKQITAVGTVLKYTQAERTGILGHFIRGGQMTAGGVLNAVTSFSQTVADADRAAELDASALKVLTLV